MEKSEMRKLAEFIEKLSWDRPAGRSKNHSIFPGPGSDQRCFGSRG